MFNDQQSKHAAKTTISNAERARRVRNAYQREYRRKHPEKVREYAERYWLRRAEHEEAQDI